MTTRDEYASAIQTALVSIIKQLVIKFAVEKFAFLAGGFFNPILGFFAGMLADYLGKQAEIHAFILYSDFRIDAEGRDFLAAAVKNNIAQQSGTKEEQLAAEKEFISSADKFISLVS